MPYLATFVLSLASFFNLTFGNVSFINDLFNNYITYGTLNSFQALASRQQAIFAYNPIDPALLVPVPHKIATFQVATSAVAGEKISSDPTLDVFAESAILIDTQSGDRLFEQNADRQHSIASISKLMAALVFIDNNPGWDTVYTFRVADQRDGGKSNIHPGEQLSARDLFNDALIASDNAAIIGLVNLTGLTEEQFVDQMNQRAVSMGLKDTVFNDPTGLSSNNVSTAAEVSVFARQAFLQPDIRGAVLTNHYTIKLIPKGTRRISSTDDLLDGDLGDIEILGGKTGFVTKAGYCFVGNFTNQKQEVISVVLGAPTIKARFTETFKILNWYYEGKENSASSSTSTVEIK